MNNSDKRLYNVMYRWHFEENTQWWEQLHQSDRDRYIKLFGFVSLLVSGYRLL